MKKSTFEQMDGTYREEGDHLLPNLTVPGNISVGIWGKRRRRYLRKHRQTLYTALLFGGKLDTTSLKSTGRRRTCFLSW